MNARAERKGRGIGPGPPLPRRAPSWQCPARSGRNGLLARSEWNSSVRPGPACEWKLRRPARAWIRPIRPSSPEDLNSGACPAKLQGASLVVSALPSTAGSIAPEAPPWYLIWPSLWARQATCELAGPWRVPTRQFCQSPDPPRRLAFSAAPAIARGQRLWSWPAWHLRNRNARHLRSAARLRAP